MRKCMCCNQETNNLTGFTVTKRNSRESIFHGDNFTIELCDKCKCKVNDIWFDNEGDYHTYENQLLEFIETWITEYWALERIWNCENDLIGSIDPEDWYNDMAAAFAPKYKNGEYDDKYTPKNEWSNNLSEKEELEIACAYSQNWMN